MTDKIAEHVATIDRHPTELYAEITCTCGWTGGMSWNSAMPKSLLDRLLRETAETHE